MFVYKDWMSRLAIYSPTEYPHRKKIKRPLQLSVSKLIKIIELCTNQFFFKYDNTDNLEKFGLPMGSPLSSFLVYLHLGL